MSDIAIEVKNLSKIYKIYSSPKDLFWETFFRKKRYQEFKALNNISFTLKKGEVVGIIGRNGAGKSTLLKILSGTLNKNSGDIITNGRVSAILELGTGFHSEYTGRENIYNGGMLLGMSKKEIEKKIDSIIEFSELGEFIDRPFKTYSDGMKIRLSFSVATAITPEILIIDEALSAGDSFFINKCIQRISDLCSSGATVLFVSHNTFLVQRLCTRAILLEKGRLKMDSDPVTVCQQYEFDVLKETSKKIKIQNQRKTNKKTWGTGPLKISRVRLLDKDSKESYSFFQGERLTIKIDYKTPTPIKNPGVYCLFSRNDGVYATSFFSAEKETFHPKINLGNITGQGSIEIYLPKLYLGEGEFYLTVAMFPEKKKNQSALHVEPFDSHDRCYRLTVKRKSRPLQTVFDQEMRLKKDERL